MSTEEVVILLWKINHFFPDIHIQVMQLLLKIFHSYLPYRAQYVFALVQIIFYFVDQNQQHHILSLNLVSYEQ